jgi:hypothetical protein
MGTIHKAAIMSREMARSRFFRYIDAPLESVSSSCWENQRDFELLVSRGVDRSG